MAGNRFRYGAWRDGPDPLAAPYDVRAAVDEVGERVLGGESLRDALRDLLRRGPRDGRGLDDLQARARRMRRDVLRRGNLDGAVTRAQQLLDQAIAAERDELARRDDDDARFNEAVLDNLPRSTAQAVQELSDYDWASDEARATYQQILDGLRREVVEQRFAGMKQALQGRDPASDARISEMLTDLNDLLGRHARGEDTSDAFQQFMAKHGEFFPDNPQNMDELDDLLQQLGQEHPGATLDDVDVEAVERQLGRSAADDVRRLRELERELRRQGWVTRDDDGLTLSPKALRRLGRTALARVFSDLSGKRRGEHDLRDAGAAGDLTGSSRRWVFGDEQPLDVVRTIGNAVRRLASGGSTATLNSPAAENPRR